MKILLDQNISRRLRAHLPGHLVIAARSAGFDRMTNGILLQAAERSGCDLMITADTGIYHQQNHHNRKIALLLVTPNKWAALRTYVAIIQAAVERAMPGGFEKLVLPWPLAPER